MNNYANKLEKTSRHKLYFYFIISLSLLSQTLNAEVIGYSEEELVGLKQREQIATFDKSQISGYSKSELNELDRIQLESQLEKNKPVLNMDELWDKAKSFEQQIMNMQEEAFSPILQQAKIEQNPNSKAKGVLIFASLGMPNHALKQLLIQSAELDVPIVIRGVLPTGFAATVGEIHRLVQPNKNEAINSGMAINPLWFKQLGIKHVPAFAVIRPGKCIPGKPCAEHDFDIVYGNLSLYEALNILARDGEVPDVAKNVLARRK
ncbi:type-F conjugative transfer system pilin assembly protein TrbC [Photobacterium sp. R1]